MTVLYIANTNTSSGNSYGPTLFAHFSCRSSCILRGGLTALKNRDLQNAVARLLSQGFPPGSNGKAMPSLCLLHHLGFFRVGGVDEGWEDFVGGCQSFLGDQVAAMSSQSFHKFSKLLCTMTWGWMVVAVQSLSMSDSLLPHGLLHGQVFLFFSIPWIWLKLMSIKSVMSSNRLILCCPLLFLSLIFPIIRVFSNELTLCVRWPKYWSFNFSFSISPSKEYPGLTSFRID